MDERIEENVLKQTAYFVGLDRGIDQGILEKQKEIVTNMYKDNCSLELISKYTNLTIQEIKKIIDNEIN